MALTVNPKLSTAQAQSYLAEEVKLRAILAAGVSGIQADKAITYDMIAVRKRLRDVNQILYPQRRPRIATIGMGDF